jgi:hypothetical protein
MRSTIKATVDSTLAVLEFDIHIVESNVVQVPSVDFDVGGRLEHR